MANWVKKGEEVVQFIMVFGIGLGFALFFLSVFVTAIGSTSTGGTAVNGIITDVNTSLTQVGGPLIEIALLLIIYVLARSSGLLGKTGGKKE
jgi:hypothetical protein